MKTKAHQKYKLKNGTVVKGVTTIINQNLGWNKNVLIGWARKLALAGIDPYKQRDKAADIGTIAHYLIECYNNKVEPELKDYAQNDIDIAYKCFNAYKDWEKENNLVTMHTELQLVSEIWEYGGTLDWIGTLNDKLAILDYKTGDSIYPEHKIQAAAYEELYYENNKEIIDQDMDYYILHLAKDGSFAPYKMSDLDKYWQLFIHLLRIDEIGKELKTL